MFKIGDKVIAFKNNEEYEGEIVGESLSYNCFEKIYVLELKDGGFLTTKSSFIKLK